MITSNELFARIDDFSMATLIVEHFAADATMVFGNNEPMVGRDAMVAGTAHFGAAIKALRHRIRQEWTVADTSIVVTEATYTRLDAKQVTIPATAIWRVGGDGLISDFRVYYDPSPVFAP